MCCMYIVCYFATGFPIRNFIPEPSNLHPTILLRMEEHPPSNILVSSCQMQHVRPPTFPSKIIAINLPGWPILWRKAFKCRLSILLLLLQHRGLAPMPTSYQHNFTLFIHPSIHPSIHSFTHLILLDRWNLFIHTRDSSYHYAAWRKASSSSSTNYSTQ